MAVKLAFDSEQATGALKSRPGRILVELYKAKRYNSILLGRYAL